MASDDEGAFINRPSVGAQRRLAGFEVPALFRTAGVGAWLLLGIAGVLALLLLLIALVAEVAIPLAIAAVLAAILVPLADRLERWRVPRWLGATFVLILALSMVVITIAVIINGLTSQSDEIWAQIEASLEQVDDGAASSEGASDNVVDAAHEVARMLTSGLLGSLFSSASSLVVGSVLAIFMLLFLLKDWEQIVGWTAGRLGVPPVVGRRMLDGTVDAFRGYAAGLTLIGAANAVVVVIGALVLGVPLAGTIALVSFVTSYVPYLGAFVAGAFAVLIAYGSGGLGDAVAMLAIVLLANNTIQNVVEPFAFGTRLRLHPLAVLLTVTTATLLFGVMGAILAAPLTSAAVNAYHELRRAGLPSSSSPAGGGVGLPPRWGVGARPTEDDAPAHRADPGPA
jgi:predicted PurR-regulated permease PerM